MHSALSTPPGSPALLAARQPPPSPCKHVAHGALGKGDQLGIVWVALDDQVRQDGLKQTQHAQLQGCGRGGQRGRQAGSQSGSAGSAGPCGWGWRCREARRHRRWRHRARKQVQPHAACPGLCPAQGVPPLPEGGCLTFNPPTTTHTPCTNTSHTYPCAHTDTHTHTPGTAWAPG